MEALAFETETKKGMIQIPKEYLALIPEKIKVIILLEEEQKVRPESGRRVEKKKKRKFTTFLNVKTKGYKFNRDELYER